MSLVPFTRRSFSVGGRPSSLSRHLFNYSIVVIKFFIPLQFVNNGLLAEWLGGGLQNRIRRFKSARDLNKIPAPTFLSGRDFLFATHASLSLKWDANEKARTPLISGAGILLMGQPKTAITAGNPTSQETLSRISSNK